MQMKGLSEYSLHPMSQVFCLSAVDKWLTGGKGIQDRSSLSGSCHIGRPFGTGRIALIFSEVA